MGKNIVQKIISSHLAATDRVIIRSACIYVNLSPERSKERL